METGTKNREKEKQKGRRKREDKSMYRKEETRKK